MGLLLNSCYMKILKVIDINLNVDNKYSIILVDTYIHKIINIDIESNC